jgi:hypothetical protein
MCGVLDNKSIRVQRTGTRSSLLLCVLNASADRWSVSVDVGLELGGSARGDKLI